jgi:uncharacterized membrane protein YoaT (DUF817 family)
MLARTQSRFHDVRVRLENYVPRTAGGRLFWELFLFGFKEAWACLFGGALLALLLLTKWLWPAGAPLTRYDFLFLAALAIQAMLLLLRMETVREAQIVFVFHVIGTVMELFKTNVGSWVYPEPSLFHIGAVPLFSGFMYASIGSYLARVTRIFDLRYSRYPDRRLTAVLAVLIYVNFFSHHYLPDIRVLLFLLAAIAFGPTWVYFRPYRKSRRMPLLLGFALIALFIWAAENIGTFTTVWLYPHQAQAWELVRLGKYGSWFLLMIISFILVSVVNRPRPPVSEAEGSATLLGAARAERRSLP